MTYRDAARGGPSHGHRWTSAFVRVVRGDGKDRTCISGDMLADRRRQTDVVQTRSSGPIGDGVIIQIFESFYTTLVTGILGNLYTNRGVA